MLPTEHWFDSIAIWVPLLFGP